MPKLKATFTTSDLSRKSGDIIAEAMRGPVTITQRNKPRLVVMSVEDFQLLREHGDTRKAFRTEDMSEEHLAMFAEALEEYRNLADD
jgi:prevent-host-death family protein